MSHLQHRTLTTLLSSLTNLHTQADSVGCQQGFESQQDSGSYGWGQIHHAGLRVIRSEGPAAPKPPFSPARATENTVMPLSLRTAAVSWRSTGRRGFSCLSAVRFNLTTKFMHRSKVTSPVRPREDLILSSRAQCSVTIWYWRVFTPAVNIEFPQWHSCHESQQPLNFLFGLLQFFS